MGEYVWLDGALDLAEGACEGEVDGLAGVAGLAVDAEVGDGPCVGEEVVVLVELEGLHRAGGPRETAAAEGLLALLPHDELLRNAASDVLRDAVLVHYETHLLVCFPYCNSEERRGRFFEYRRVGYLFFSRSLAFLTLSGAPSIQASPLR